MKENRNAGFTLVEMLIAMLISLIIISGVGIFMVTATRNYQATDKQVDLQLEAQDVANAISDRILEANNVYYDPKSDDIYIRIYYGLESGNADKKASKQDILWFDKSESTLYLFPCNGTSDYDDAYNAHSKAKLLAENVSDIQLCIGNYTMGTNNVDKEYYKNIQKNKKNPVIQIVVEMKSIMVSGGSKDRYTYKVNVGAAPRSEIVGLE